MPFRLIPASISLYWQGKALLSFLVGFTLAAAEGFSPVDLLEPHGMLAWGVLLVTAMELAARITAPLMHTWTGRRKASGDIFRSVLAGMALYTFYLYFLASTTIFARMFEGTAFGVVATGFNYGAFFGIVIAQITSIVEHYRGEDGAQSFIAAIGALWQNPKDSIDRLTEDRESQGAD